MNCLTFQDLTIASDDMDYIDNLCEEFNIRYNEIDIPLWFADAVRNPRDFSSSTFTNMIIDSIMCLLIEKYVDDEHDKDLLYDNIYTNCLDSHYDVDINELNTQEAKNLVIKFG